MAIDKQFIDKALAEFIKDKDYFVVDTKVSPNNAITILIDHPKGITIDDCVSVSRFIEKQLNRDENDFELQVSSPGLDEPLKIPEQYQKNIGRTLEVWLTDHNKLKGTLQEATHSDIKLSYKERVKEEGKNKKKTINQERIIQLSEIKKAKVVITFK